MFESAFSQAARPPRKSWLQRNAKVLAWVAGAVIVLLALIMFVDCTDETAVRLDISATRESPLRVEPESLSFPAPARADFVERSFEIHNTSARDHPLSMQLLLGLSGITQTTIEPSDLTSPMSKVLALTTRTEVRRIDGSTETAEIEVFQLGLLLESGELIDGYIPANGSIRVRAILANEQGSEEGRIRLRLIVD